MNAYDVIKTVAITEKTTMLQENDQYTFIVHSRASKGDIKQAVEELFDRKVKSVNVINRKGKKRRTRFGVGKKADTRKAIVTLKDGEDPIELF
jgi:large subunit ribosomal protein L23